MKYQFFRVDMADPEAGAAELNAFCLQHRIAGIEKQFVADGANSYWAFCVCWLEQHGAALPNAKPKSGKIDYREVLNEQDFAVYARLRDLRKSLAEQEGTPPYHIFTNEQLAAMVQQRINSKSGLLALSGVGQARADKYAAAFIECLHTVDHPYAPD